MTVKYVVTDEMGKRGRQEEINVRLITEQGSGFCLANASCASLPFHSPGN